MKVSGFYNIESKSKENAIKILDSMFKDDIFSIKLIYGDFECKTTDCILTGREYQGGYKEYDVHFVLDLKDINFREDAEAFHNLEKKLTTELRVVDIENEVTIEEFGRFIERVYSICINKNEVESISKTMLSFTEMQKELAIRALDM